MKQIIFTFDPDEYKSEIVDEITKNVISYIDKIQRAEDTILLTRKEASQLLRISISSLERRTKKGELTAYYQGDRVFYKKHEILNSLIASK